MSSDRKNKFKKNKIADLQSSSSAKSSLQNLPLQNPLAKNTLKNEETPEIDGPKGLEPTRYGDWERNGICRDF